MFESTKSKVIGGVVASVVGLVIIAAVAGGGEETGSTVPNLTTTPSVEATTAPRTTVGADKGSCEDGSQASCAVYQITFNTFSEAYPNASIEWLDCVATTTSDAYPSVEEFADSDSNTAAELALTACGFEGSGE